MPRPSCAVIINTHFADAIFSKAINCGKYKFQDIGTQINFILVAKYNHN